MRGSRDKHDQLRGSSHVVSPHGDQLLRHRDAHRAFVVGAVAAVHVPHESHAAERENSRGGAAAPRDVCFLLDPISRGKYPAVTAEEEAISVPLQTACMAAFDGILVHLVNALAPGKWHGIKREMVASLNENKTARTLAILASPAYRTCDVVCVQEASAALARDLETHETLGERYHVLCPENLDGKRDQNSLVLCCKERFEIHDPEWRGETTASVAGLVAKDAPAGVAPGDLRDARRRSNREGRPGVRGRGPVRARVVPR